MRFHKAVEHYGENLHAQRVVAAVVPQLLQSLLSQRGVEKLVLRGRYGSEIYLGAALFHVGDYLIVQTEHLRYVKAGHIR